MHHAPRITLSFFGQISENTRSDHSPLPATTPPHRTNPVSPATRLNPTRLDSTRYHSTASEDKAGQAQPEQPRLSTPLHSTLPHPSPTPFANSSNPTFTRGQKALVWGRKGGWEGAGAGHAT
ncbi:hypothetical protein BO70DRAFT_130152 [Aspergillus heteromorphus CBS 117.55]|uniref:Uncharacterized protein n=1 Tax=Aspergillus heteromorphus CBS 117.55 TaxID=1448321 RepID=A0A317WU66_9EURO|nr:uncharacterized protein BO70DRAFT_130152 [Aspergillus heteromorphus CBS 117.55]PWY89879.1 hypothetical protein BO70DRAFT_130152 [Aspergillus heteromorphus CBS 117.55]